MTPALPARLRIALVVLAWLAQAWMPVVHATAMASPTSAHGIWCGDAAGAQQAWAALPADLRAALDDGTAASADHLASCTLLCAFASTPPPAGQVPATERLRAAGLETAAADPCCPPGRPQSTTPPAQAPPTHS